MGKIEEAKQSFSRAVELNYEPRNSYYLLGTVHKSLKEYGEARDSLLKSLEFQKNPFTYYLLGDVYFDMKDYKQARDAYHKALESNYNRALDNNLDKLYYSIGLVNEKLGDFKEAERAHRKAKEIEKEKQISDKYRLMSKNLFLICGLVMTFFIGLASISPLRMYFRTGMKGLLFMGLGGLLGGIGLFGIILNSLGGYLGEVPIVLLVLLIIAGVPMVAIGSVIISTSESGFYVELGEKTTFRQRLTGNIPILKYDKPPPPSISRRTGLICGITAMTLGSLIIIPYILFKIPPVFMSFFIGAIFAFILGLLLVIFSIIYLDKGNKSPE